MDFGDQDYWLEDGAHLHETLTERGIEHQWRVSPGDHEGLYWLARMPSYLRFYSESFATP